MRLTYGALRLWATVLIFVGVLGVVFVVIGTIFAVIPGENLRTRPGDAPDRRSARCAVRQLADRAGTGLEGDRRRSRVRPGAAEQGQ
jgi:hypothetical protein